MGRRTPEHLGPATLPNRKCPFTSTAQEQAVRQEAAEAHLQVLRSQLPQILARLARIPDPRRRASVEHDLPTLLLYGILLFTYQYASRREGNRELSRPEFLAPHPAPPVGWRRNFAVRVHGAADVGLGQPAGGVGERRAGGSSAIRCPRRARLCQRPGGLQRPDRAGWSNGCWTNPPCGCSLVVWTVKT